MKKILLTRMTTAAFAAFLLATGCKKENSGTLSTQEEQQAANYSAESETESEVAFNDVFDNVVGVNSDLGFGEVGIFGRVATDASARTDSFPRCASVTITPMLPLNAFPKTVTIDFGAGCQSHGHFRSGKITTVYTGPLRIPGSTATTTFTNFRFDSVQVEGTHTIANTTNNTAGSNQRQFRVEVKDGKLTRPNGNYNYWNTVRLNTQVEGNGSVTPRDDIFQISGSGNGRVKRENLLVEWTSEITEPLVKKFTCRWISKGRIRTVRQGLAQNSPWVGILDYGDGTCDNQAALTVNGVTKQITLR